MMKLTRRQQWVIVAGLAGAVAARLAEHGATRGWRLATGDDPPKKPAKRQMGFTRDLMLTVGLATVAAVAQVGARHGARMWKKRNDPVRRGRLRRAR